MGKKCRKCKVAHGPPSGKNCQRLNDNPGLQDFIDEPIAPEELPQAIEGPTRDTQPTAALCTLILESVNTMGETIASMGVRLAALEREKVTPTPAPSAGDLAAGLQARVAAIHIPEEVDSDSDEWEPAGVGSPPP